MGSFNKVNSHCHRQEEEKDRILNRTTTRQLLRLDTEQEEYEQHLHQQPHRLPYHHHTSSTTLHLHSHHSSFNVLLEHLHLSTRNNRSDNNITSNNNNNKNKSRKATSSSSRNNNIHQSDQLKIPKSINCIIIF